MVGIDRDVGVGQEHFQPQSPLVRILEGLRERLSRCETLSLKLSLDPVKERLDVWLAMSQSMQALVLTEQLMFADLFFNLIKRCDPLEGPLDTLWLVRSASKNLRRQ
jgi:hypothetical protein